MWTQKMIPSHDPYNLKRFLQAQEDVYEHAIQEIRHGQKLSHWMWFIFPQLAGLGTSPMAQHYAIQGIEEARAYLAHPILGLRLLECAEAVLQVEGRSAEQIFGYPDDLKLHSCATLFAQVEAQSSVFERLLQKFYGQKRDAKTLALLGRSTTIGP